MTVWFVMFWIAAGTLAYALVGYPLLMWVIARRARPIEPAAPRDWPSVSLIIPAHNEELVIAAKLRNVLALDYPADRLDVIVASDGSTDATVEIASRFRAEGVEVLDLQPNRGKSTALNAAAAQARGDVLCLCDANVLFRPDALRRMVAHFDDPRIGAVTGDVRIASEESDFETGERSYYSIERRIQLGESRFGSTIGVDGGMYVVRRELFQDLRPDTILDDFETSLRVIRQGARLIYEPRAIATENGTPTWKQEFVRRIRVKTGVVQSLKRGLWPRASQPLEVWKYLSHKLLRWLGPVWLVLLMIASIRLRNAGLIYQVALYSQLAFYGLAVLALASQTVRRTRLGGMAFYFTLSHIAMVVGLVRGLVCRPSGIWRRTSRTPVASPDVETSETCPVNGLPQGADQPHSVAGSSRERIRIELI
ncbi:MAG: glycosyltransferase family 2 protein [Planctomyces sp.]|nr:glycosyltransferase family 2 protein [Planctomyces sp.]